MAYLVTFYFVMTLPGSAPMVSEEKVATLEECVGMVARYEMRARDLPREGRYQAGCAIEIPATLAH